MSMRVPQPKPVRVTVALIGVGDTLRHLQRLTPSSVGAALRPTISGRIATTSPTASTAAAAATAARLSQRDRLRRHAHLVQQRVENLGAQRRGFRRFGRRAHDVLAIEHRQQRGDAADLGDGRSAPRAGLQVRLVFAAFVARQ